MTERVRRRRGAPSRKGYGVAMQGAIHELHFGDRAKAARFYARFRPLLLEDLDACSTKWGPPRAATFVVEFEPPGALRRRGERVIEEGKRRRREFGERAFGRADDSRAPRVR